MESSAPYDTAAANQSDIRIDEVLDSEHGYGNATGGEEAASESAWEYPERYVVPIVFGLIFVVGIVGNGTLIYTVIRNKTMRNTPNIFIVSLAIGDLLLLVVSVPFTSTIYTFDSWPYGEEMCKVNEFLQSLSLGVSVFTLTALSGDRYAAIVYPMSMYTGFPTIRTFAIAGFIWVLSMALAVLDAVAARLEPNAHGQSCVTAPRDWPSWYPEFHAIYRFTLFFALPIVIIGCFYFLMAWMLFLSSSQMPGEGHAARQIKARKKVARLVLSFVLVFIVCWLPRHIYTMWYNFDPSPYNMFWHVFKILGFCLSFINSCVNPLALYFLSKQFRRFYNRYLFCCCRRGDPQRCNGEHVTFADHSETKTTMYNFNSTTGGAGRLTGIHMTSVPSRTTC